MDAYQKDLIRGLVNHLSEYGWRLVGGSDGEEELKFTDVYSAIEMIESVEISCLYFKFAYHLKARTQWVGFIPENGAEEMIYDWTCPRVPDGTINSWEESWRDAMDSFGQRDLRTGGDE